VQLGLGHSWALEAGYVGSHYVGGLGIYNPFLAPLASPSNPIHVTDINGNNFTITTNTVNNEALRSQALGLSRRRGARIDGNIGQAIYHSGQLTVSHRFRHGLFFQAAYTYSKEIDNVSGSQSTDELNATQAGQGGATILNFGNNPAANRSVGDFDRRQRAVFSYNYELPVPKHGIWGTQAFQGWSFSGINVFQDGLPFSVTDPTGGRAFGGGTSTGIFTCGSLANAYTGGDINNRLNGYLNPACFAPAPIAPSSSCIVNGLVTTPCPSTQTANATAPTGYGTIPRNAFRGPFQQNWDFSLMKHFKVHESHVIDFRTDFFNVLNHPSFRQPSTVSIGSSTFGQINSTVNPARLIQFGLQYSF